MAETVWILGGDPTVEDAGLRDALARIGSAVTVIPAGEGHAWWTAPTPHVVVFGASATGPLHPLAIRAIRGGARAVLVTDAAHPAHVPGDVHVHLALPSPISRVLTALRRALGQRAPQPAFVAVAQGVASSR